MSSLRDKDKTINKRAAENKARAELEAAGSILKLRLDDIIVEENVRRQFMDSSIRELAESIKSVGQQLPITVKKHPTLEGKWILVTGERRYRASKLLNAETILAREDDGNLTRVKQIVENIQREDMNIADLGNAFQELIDKDGMKPTEIAQLVGKDLRFVYRALSVSALPGELQELCVNRVVKDVNAIEMIRRLIEEFPERKERITTDVLRIASGPRIPAGEDDEDEGSSAENAVTRRDIRSLRMRVIREVQAEKLKKEERRGKPGELFTLGTVAKLKDDYKKEGYRFNKLNARIACAFFDVDETQPNNQGELLGMPKNAHDLNDLTKYAQLLTVTTNDKNCCVVEWDGLLYEVPTGHIMLKGVVSIEPGKGRKGRKKKGDDNDDAPDVAS